MKKEKFVATIRAQLSLLHGPGPVLEGSIQTVLAAADDYAQTRADEYASTSLFSQPSVVAVPSGTRGILSGLREDLEGIQEIVGRNSGPGPGIK